MPDRNDEPKWFTADQIIRLNEVLVAAADEPHALISRDLLEGALGRPVNYLAYNKDACIVELGVLLIDAIGKNHCFIQGNKRTAFHAGISFMRVNGVFIKIPDTEKSAKLIQQMIEGEIAAEVVVEFCRALAFVPA